MKIILASMFTQSRNKVANILKEELPAKALCITTAANVYPENKRGWQLEEMDTLRQLGIQLEAFDIAGKTTSDIQKKLAAHTAIYITGGNVYYLLEQAQLSGLVEEIKEWAQIRGKLYLGASAGAVLACPRIDYIGDMDDVSVTRLTDFSGLGFINKLVMVHANHPHYQSKAQHLITVWKKSPHTIIPLNDDQLVVWDGEKEKVL